MRIGQSQSISHHAGSGPVPQSARTGIPTMVRKKAIEPAEGLLFLGIDIGSTTLKAVLLNERGKVHHSLYQRTKAVEGQRPACTGRCNACGACHLGSLRQTIAAFLSAAGVTEKDVLRTVVTGSQVIEDTHRFLLYDAYVSEVSAHCAGAQHYYPDCRAILDVGGQDSKAMLYNEQMRMWVSKMSGICAAGTGAFLDSVAAKLGVPVEEMAAKVNYDSNLEFSSVCAVLSATSVNKFKNRSPIGDIVAGACRAQARTIMSGVGEIFFGYRGDILFQGGVAANPAVAYYLRQITGSNIVIPEFHRVMGALGAACLAREYHALKDRLAPWPSTWVEESRLKSIAMRANSTRREFFSRNDAPLVWRNLFYPAELLNAMGVRILTLETYAALFARNQKRIKGSFDNAAYKGFSAETCSFLRVLEGIDLPQPAFAVSTTEPCQQGERIFQDLARQYGFEDRFHTLHTPARHDEKSVEHIAAGLEESVARMEAAIGRKLDPGRLAEACRLSNEAREITMACNRLRMTSPPLVRGSVAVYFANMFSQLWGRQELVDMQRQFLRELTDARDRIGDRIALEDTHRILWLHLPPFYDSKLLDHIETRCHTPIVFEEVNFVDWAPLDPRDPYRSLARKLLTVGFLDPQLRVRYIRETVVAGKFNGCILYNHGFGRCSMSDSCFIKHLREELQQVPVPLLQLDGDCMDPTIDPCSTYTKVNAYAEGLNIQRYGNLFGPLDESLPGKRLRPPTLQDIQDTSNRIIHFIRDYSSKIQENLNP
jgi:predicted CoA-substrate-specific enzyme activase